MRIHDENHDVRDRARSKYRPEKIKRLLVAEAPPDAPDKFFYFEKERERDYLYTETMKVIYDGADENGLQERKVEFLKGFMENGFYLVEAVDHPIGNEVSSHQRREMVMNCRQNLIKRMRSIVDEETEIILIKASVYELCDPLREEGFNVINDCIIEFPCCGNQTKFREKMRRLLGLPEEWNRSWLTRTGRNKPCPSYDRPV